MCKRKYLLEADESVSQCFPSSPVCTPPLGLLTHATRINCAVQTCGARARPFSSPSPTNLPEVFMFCLFFFFFVFPTHRLRFYSLSLAWARINCIPGFSWLFVPNRVSRAAFGSRCARRTKTRLILGVRGAETCRSVDGRIVTVETVLNIYVFSTHVRSSSFYYSTAVCARAATERGIYEPYSGAYTCSQRHSSLPAEILQVSH